MQKVVKILEANVEWIVLGIAVLYLGWAAWTYLLNDPTAKSLNGKPVSVGNVDKVIVDTSLQKLVDTMNPDVQPPSFTVKDFNTAFQSSIDLQNLNPAQLATANFDYVPFDSTAVPSVANVTGKGNPVQQLPTLPAAKALVALAALNTLSAQQPNNNGAAPAAPPATSPAAGKDVRMVVVAFAIPWDTLYSEWNKSFGPPQAGGQPRLTPAPFQLVQIAAFRSEKIGDKWTDDQQVGIINGADLPSYPKPGDKQAEFAYLQAISKAPKSIPTPDIPPVTAGASWKDPIQYLPGAQQQPTPQPGDQPTSMVPSTGFRPTAGGTSDFHVVDVQYGPPGGGGGPRGGYGPPGGFRPPAAPTPPPDQNQEQPAQPPPPVQPADGTVTPVTALANPTATPGQALPQPAPAQLNVIAMQPKSPDLSVYVIDTTASAGKTYRYRIVYKCLNPLYNKGENHVAPKNKAWIDQFDLSSPMSDYSPEITVPKQTYFFCGQPKMRVSSNTPSGNTVFPFDVFTWSNGKWQKDTFNASVGDPIGGLVGTIDYSTGYTYVDKHPARSKTLITIVDREGNVEVRDASADTGSADYKKVTQWLTLPVVAPGTPQPAPGMPGGMPYGPGGGPPGGVPPYGGPPNGPYGGPGGYGPRSAPPPPG